MPLDIAVLQPLVDEPFFSTRGNLKVVEPAKLKTLLTSQFAKSFDQKGKIKFVDCQSDNGG
jgi:hypothetical protein